MAPSRTKKFTVLALIGKSVKNPNSAFNALKQWAIVMRPRRRKCQLKSTCLTTSTSQDVAVSTPDIQSHPSVIKQIDECLSVYATDGVQAFVIEIPSVKPLNADDRRTIREIFQTYGIALFDYVYFAMTGPYWEDDTNLRMFKQYLIDFLAQHVGVDVDHWLSVKNRILYLRQMDPFMFLWTVGQELLQQKSYQNSAPVIPALRSGIPEMNDICKKVISVPILLDFAEYFKLQSSRSIPHFAERFEIVFKKQIFANPDNMPLIAFSVLLSNLLRVIERNLGPPDQKRIINTLQNEHSLKFWQFDGDRHNFAYIDIKSFGKRSFFCAMYANTLDFCYAFSEAFEPTVDFEYGIRIYKSKDKYRQIGHAIEVYAPNVIPVGLQIDTEECRKAASVLKNGKPCFMFVDEANTYAYPEIVRALVEYQIPVRSLLIRSKHRQPDWIRVLRDSRPLFSRGDDSFKEFYYDCIYMSGGECCKLTT